MKNFAPTRVRLTANSLESDLRAAYVSRGFSRVRFNALRDLQHSNASIISPAAMNLNEFLKQAGDHGSGVGAHAETSSPSDAPPSFEVRTIDGARTKTLDAILDAFAEAWHFPQRFMHNHNRDAFDDWMRDFDNLTNPALDKQPI